LSPSAAYCDDEKSYPDQKYAEPITLTLFDLARSSDRQTSMLAQQAMDRLQAELIFSEFISKGAPECRNQWLLRLEANQAKAVLDILRSRGLPPAELGALDVGTPNTWRTIIKPTATPNGDLYRVVAKIPSGDTELSCLSKVYRLVNMQDGTAVKPKQKNLNY
jgi:hypothetical protein